MKQKQGKNIIIAVLCCLILLMGVGFAILSTELVINGNANVTGEWDIYIESITPIEEGYTGISSSAFVDQNDKTKASFTADLKKPRDFVEYKVVVKNDGNIDAILTDVLLDNTVSHNDIEFSHTASNGEILYAGGTNEFTVKVEFLESATTVERISVSSSLKLNYEQYDSNDITSDEGMGVPALASTKVMATLNDDGTVNLSVSEYGFDEVVDGIELYTSDEYDGSFTLIADIADGSSINVEKSKFNEYYEIKSYNIENGTRVYTDYTGNVELKAPTPEIEKMFIGCTAETEMVCGYSIYNINDFKYDGFALDYSDNGLAFDVATSPGEGTDVYSNATYYPPSGETYYYKIYGYLDLNGHLVYSELSDAVTITNEN